MTLKIRMGKPLVEEKVKKGAQIKFEEEVGDGVGMIVGWFSNYEWHWLVRWQRL